MSQGWVKVHRKIKECDLWNDNEPYDRRSAWIDLLLSANHEEKNVLLGNELIPVQRGSFITSVRKLCDRWKWSNTKVTAYLKLLKQMNMIDYTSDTKKTLVTIENYSVYQDSNDTETTEERQEKDAKTSQKHTNKNEKNDKNINKQQQGFDSVINAYTENEELKISILDFIKMRKAIKKPLTDHALELILKKLNTLANNDREKILILNQSIMNSWQGIFELKGQQDKPKETRPNAGAYKVIEY